MRVIVYEDFSFLLQNKFKATLHAFKGMEGVLNGLIVYPHCFGYDGSRNGILYIMETRDTEMNIFDLLVKAKKIEFKKSAFGGKLPGKKLPLVSIM